MENLILILGVDNIHEAWIIRESRLLQMRGVTHAAVVVHRKWVITKQMLRNRLARRVKNADAYKEILLEKFFQQYQDNFLILLKKNRHWRFL